MTRTLAVMIVSAVVFALGLYAGSVGSRMARGAAVPTPKTVTCGQVEARLRQDVGALESTRDRYRARLVSRYDAGVGHPARRHPSTAVASGVATEAAREVFGATLRTVHCMEYPCVAVVTASPESAALETLRGRGLEPVVREEAGAWVVALTSPGEPVVQERFARRARALVRLLDPVTPAGAARPAPR